MGFLELAKRRGFFWQSALIYGGISGFYDYGHVGTLLKRKFENLWRDYFLGLDDNFYEIQTSVILPEKVFIASGHISHFVDPVVKCSKCGAIERADHILEDVLGEKFEGLPQDELTKIIEKHGIKCGKCGGKLLPAGLLNMLMPLEIGVGDNKVRAYLTGETAQSAYLNFKLEYELLRKKLPFGLAIIGKVFRNEISPRNALIRMREFTQAELQIFFDPDHIDSHPRFGEVADYELLVLPYDQEKIMNMTCADLADILPKFYVYFMAKIQQFYLEILKLPKNCFRFRELSKEERAFYNKIHWDIELKLPSLGGFKEVGGIHYRGDHDLGSHQKFSKQNLSVGEGEKFVPHVLELSFGVDRNIYALLEIGYTKEKQRVVLKLPRILSPFDVGVFPLIGKDGLPEKAKEVCTALKNVGFKVFYDESGSIGRRYRRIDEIGVAAAVTIDYESLEKNDCTLRDRDSMAQIRVKIENLPDILKRFLHGEELNKLGKPISS